MAEKTEIIEEKEIVETEASSEEYDFVNYQSVPESESNCEPVEAVAEEATTEDCSTCIPNPHAPVIDWTKRTDAEPFLNERKCTYSITLRTQYEGTGGDEALQARLNEYIEEGVVKLLAHYDKALDSNTIAAMVSQAGATDHFVPPRPKLKMKVLIEVPANDFDAMPSAQEIKEDSTQDTSEDPEESESAATSAQTYSATLEIEGLEEKCTQVHAGLEAYARFQVIYLKTQNGTVRFPGGQMVNMLQEAKHFKKVYSGLSKWLRGKNLVMRESRGKNTLGKIPGGPKLVNKLKLDFDDNYKIVKVTVYRHGTCEESPIEFEGMRLYTLQNTYPFDRATTMAFMPNLDGMIADLRRRKGMMPWTEFVETYLWPTPTINEGVDLASTMSAFASAATGQATSKDMETLAKTAVKMSEAEKLSSKTPGSWEDAEDRYRKHTEEHGRGSYDSESGSAFDEAMGRDPESADDMAARKTLDFDEQRRASCYGDPQQWMEDFADGFMDELFSIWDAISYQFQNYLCMSPEEREELMENMREMRNQAQAAAMAEMMAIMFGFMEMIQSFSEGLDEIKDIKMLYPNALDEIKLCGLFNLLLAFIECLAVGLDLEEMLEPLIAAALKNMSPLAFKDMFVGLPPEVQIEVARKVEAELGSHVMPWDAYDIQGRPDPSAETAFGAKPSAGTVVSWGGPGTSLSKEKSAARQDPTNIPVKYVGLARRIEAAAKKIRDESAYVGDLDIWNRQSAAIQEDTLATIGDESTIKYALTEEEAFKKAVDQHSSQWSQLEQFAEEYNLSYSAYTTAQDLINFNNGSSSREMAGASTTVAGVEVGIPEAGTESIKQSVEYQTTYAQAINEYCENLAAAEIASGAMTADSSEEIRAWRANCEISDAAVKYADAAATAAYHGSAFDDGTLGSNGPYGTRGSLGAALGSSVSTILSAYAQALLDYYVVNGALKELKDYVMDRPGAAFVAKIIASIDCIVPPLFDPPLFDFLNTLEIDFCNNQYGIVLPRLASLPIPSFKDFFKYIIQYAKEILLYILFRLLLYILTKIVLMLFDSLCKALQQLGEMASAALADAACAAMKDAGGFLGDVADEASTDKVSVEEQEFDQHGNPIQSQEGSSGCEDPPRSLNCLIGEAFCPGWGTDACDDERVDATVNELMRALGGVTEADAARMANSDSVNQLVADMSSVLTGNELADLLLGNPNPGAVAMVQEVVQTENPDFASALGSPGQIRDLMKNMGNMMPPQFRKKLRDDLSVPKGERPANPNLCTTQSDIKRFRDLRNTILQNKDGTTLDQANQQFDALRGRALNDIAEAGDLLQGGVENFIANNLPPMVGAPDPSLPQDPCTDGGIPANAIIPRDPEELSELLSDTNEKMYDIVGRAFQRDLIGRKGMLDMILSDTCGVPYSRHERKSRFSFSYSDYKGELLTNFGMEPAGTDENPYEGLPLFIQSLGQREKGDYPKYVSQYLRDYLAEGKHLGEQGYTSTSEYAPKNSMLFSGLAAQYGVQPVDSTGALLGTEDNPIVLDGGKDPDLVLEFRDNNKGLGVPFTPEFNFAEGFNLEYGSYLIEEDDEGNPIPVTDNIYNLRIVEVTNELTSLPLTPSALLDDIEPPALDDPIMEDEIIDINIHGALSEEAEEIRLQYDLSKNTDMSPQNNLWTQFLQEKFTNLGLSEEQQSLISSDTLFSAANASETYDNIVNTMLAYMGKNVADNEPAYLFGYEPGVDDDLDIWDKMYMDPDTGEKPFIQWVKEDLFTELAPEGQPSEYRRDNGKPRMRKLKKYIKENQIMGKSNNPRLEFLSPAEFGGSWMAPPYYITPPVQEGWLGIKEALLPEIDGKEPKRTSVCNFEDIKDRVDDLTKNMPDDPRLSECPDCVVELPYSRILDRAAAGGMEGPILGLIRIYVLEEMLKAMPVFSNFKAVIPEVMDHTYVEYIIAKMKIDFTDNLGRKRGFLKGDALWYTFLEQCVQSYGRRIQLDGLVPPADVEEAIETINALQKTFHYPDEEDLTRAKMAAGHNPWEKYGVEVAELEPEIVFDRVVNPTTRIQWYRRWHLLQAVKDTEESANVVVRQLVEEQLEFMAERFAEALKSIDMDPEITDIHKYFIGSGDFVAGRDGFEPDKPSTMSAGNIMDVAMDLDSNPLESYASSEWGTKLKADVYVGMATGNSETTSVTIDGYASRLTDGEFILEKYVRVEDKSELGITDELPEAILQRSSQTRGVVNINTWKAFLGGALMQEHQESKLSDFFGDLEFTYALDEEGNPTGDPTGIVGSTGVKYGLRISYIPPESMADELESILNTLKESDNWAEIEDMASKEKAYFLEIPELSVHNGALEVGTDAGKQVTVVTKGTTNALVGWNATESPSVNRTQAVYDLALEGTIEEHHNSYRPKNARFVIPIAQVEYDALDHTLATHAESIDEELDLQCLAEDLVKTPEFELIFRYVFPLNRITSLMSIYTGRAFMMSIGEKVKEMDMSDLASLMSGGYPTPDREAGEWQQFGIRMQVGRHGASFDRWDDDFLFRRTKRRLVRMFRTYFKSRDFLSGGDDDGDGSPGDFTGAEKDRKRQKNKDKGMKRGPRKLRRRQRDRPYDKNGN